MNNRVLITVILLGIVSSIQAQKLNMRDAVLGLGTNLRVENLRGLNWIPNQNTYTEIVRTDYGNALIARELIDFKVDTLLRSTDFEHLKFIPSLNWIDENTAYYRSDSSLVLWDRNTRQSIKWVTLPSNTEEMTVEKESKSVAYVLDNNLFMVDTDLNIHQITYDGTEEIVNGRSVHREEFGIDRGIFFSPFGNLLAFYRMDQSMVEDYPIIDWSTVPAVNKNIKYPFAGRKSHHVTVGVYNPKNKTTIFLNTGEPADQYLTNISWAPDEKSIYIQVLNRDQNRMLLNQYDVISGKLMQTLLEEKNDKYVEPQHELYFLPNGKEFVYWSQRDGWMHLYRYDLNGRLLNKMTTGAWLVNEIVGMNKSKNELFITGTKDGVMEQHLYAVNWLDGGIRRIDTEPGWHSFNVNSTGQYVIDTWSNETTPRIIDVLSTDKRYKWNLLMAKNPLEKYEMPKVENVTLKADDGTDLYGKLIYPSDFNPNMKYPVIVYLYNGPHLQLNKNRFPASGNLWYDYMAQNGYMVWVMDGRGSSNRGLEFEQKIFRQLGKYEMEDQMKGVEYLKSLTFVDGDRMGIHGWSYGGFMVTSFMLRKPDVFKVGVAGGPVLDWRMYEIMYGERYMDTPESNPEGYAESLSFLIRLKISKASFY